MWKLIYFKNIGVLSTLIALVCYYLPCYSQSNLYADKSLSEILDLTFELDLEKRDLSIYDKKPLIENGLLIEHFDNNFIYDLDRQRQLFFSDRNNQNIIKSKLKDSLVLYDLMNLVVVKNIYNGAIVYKRSKQRGYQIESKTPILLRSDTILFKEKNNILNCINIFTKSTIWQRSFPEMIYAFIEDEHGLISLTTKTTFYQLDKRTGDTIWSLPLVTSEESSLNSEINVSGRLLYLWGEKEGIIVVDLNERAVKSRWLDNLERPNFTLQIAFENDTIFAKTPSNIYSLSQSTGGVFWVSEEVPIRSDLIVHSDFIFFYQKGREGGANALSALSRISHKIEYATFTSDEFPPKDLGKGIYDSDLDLTNINFNRKLYYDNFLIGSDGSKIYCFEIAHLTFLNKQ